MAATPPICDFGWTAPDFALPATDGQTLRFADVAGSKGTLIVFMCNHCPYVKAVLPRLVIDARELLAMGIGVAAISSNDVEAYPEDSFERMAELAAAEAFPFPYLYDADQSVARAYGAVCTPDFFGFNAERGLQYRGRIDASRKDAAPPDAPRELVDAMRMVAETGHGPEVQVPSMGCSIKWRAA